MCLKQQVVRYIPWDAIPLPVTVGSEVFFFLSLKSCNPVGDWHPGWGMRPSKYLKATRCLRVVEAGP